jgi:hypothetical protein
MLCQCVRMNQVPSFLQWADKGRKFPTKQEGTDKLTDRQSEE